MTQGKRGRSEGGEGTGQVMQHLVGHRKNFGFYPEGGGSLGKGGLWVKEEQDQFRCSQVPSSHFGLETRPKAT